MKVRISLAPNKFAGGGEIPPYRTGDPSVLKRDLNNRVILPSFNDLFFNHRPEDIYEEEGYIPLEQGKGHQYTYNDIYTDYIGRLNKYNQSLPANDSANILTNEKRTSQGLNRIGDTGAMPVVNDMFKGVNTLLGYGMQAPIELAKTALMPGSYIPYAGATNQMGELIGDAVDNAAGALFAPIMPSNYIDWGSAGRDGVHLKLPWQHNSNSVETPAFMQTMDFAAAPYLAKGVNQVVKYGKQYVNPFYKGRNQPVNLINERVGKVELASSEFDPLFEKYDPLFKKLATENIEYNPKKYVSYPYEYRDEKIGLFKPIKHGKYRKVSEDFPFFKSALKLAELENKNSISVAEPQYFATSTFDSYIPNILNIRKYPSPIKPNPVKALEGTYYDYAASPMIQDNVRRLVHWMPEHTKRAAERYLDTGDLKSILQDETLTLAEKRQIANLGRYNSYVIDPNTNLFYTNVRSLIKNNKAIAKEINALSKAEQREVLNAAGMNTVDDAGNPINVVPKGVDELPTRGHEINHAFQRKARQPSNMRKMINATLPTKQYNKEGKISGNELRSTGSSALMDEKGSTIQDARTSILSSEGLPPDTPMETLNSIIDKMSNEDLLKQYRTVYGRDYIEEIKKIPNYNYDALREITKYGFKYGGNLFPDGGTLDDDDIPMYGSTQQEAVITGHRMPAWNRFWNKNFRSKSGWDKYVDRYYARQQQMQDTNNTPNPNYEVPDALSIAGIIAGTPYNEDIERAKIWDTYNNWKEHNEIIGPHYDPDGNYHNDAYTNPSAGYLSGTDPIGEALVLNEALGPLAKFVGRGTQQVMAKAGNQWARNQIMGRAFNNVADASFDFNNRFVTTPASSVGYEIKPKIINAVPYREPYSYITDIKFDDAIELANYLRAKQAAEIGKQRIENLLNSKTHKERVINALHDRSKLTPYVAYKDPLLQVQKAKLEIVPKIDKTINTNAHNGGTTVGKYNPNTHTVTIASRGKNKYDLESIAQHEYAHASENEELLKLLAEDWKDIKPTSFATKNSSDSELKYITSIPEMRARAMSVLSEMKDKNIDFPAFYKYKIDTGQLDGNFTDLLFNFGKENMKQMVNTVYGMTPLGFGIPYLMNNNNQ